ncbi:extracellular solute-binding protein [Psychrobacter sp.]|uniref:extracellular solute-binding protein n=1 Tax=Psychrobacter sp. TaxID=56811 RepID=UPI0025F13282|nr:extracellular solute-binding protein [Psychrobacter sp.]
MHKVVSSNSKLLKKTLSVFIIAALTLSGCSNDQKNKVELPSEKVQISLERFQIGTDLDIKSLKPLSDAYHKETGIVIEWIPIDKKVFTISFDEEAPLHYDVKLPKGLDMLMMHSVYTMANASASQVLQPIGSEVLNTKVPDQYKDPDGKWFGVGKYAQGIVYNKNRVNVRELVNYAGLGAINWRGRLCMTDIYSPENQAIAKMMISYNGTKLTPEILANWQTNMGTPLANNKQILSTMEQGNCDVGIVDSDTFWSYAKTHPSTQIRMMWPNQINRGAITNAITIGMVNTGEEVGQALKFMEWLMSDRGQALLTFYTSTFPVVDIKDETVNMLAVRPEWTKFKADEVPLKDIINNHSKIKAAEIKPEIPEAVTDDESTKQQQQQQQQQPQ